jgi:centrosomal protein CEP104
MSGGVTKLKFRVVSCSSEDPDFLVTELLKHGPHTKGWQSARFCDYPQEIILQMSVPARIKQLQFLSHQFKVSSKIELYSYCPESPGTVPALDSIKFKRLGYLSLDSNEQSNYQARELKSVYIDVTSLYLKLVLNKCHINKFNLFNQVGLIAVNCLGEELTEPGRPIARNALPESLENEMEFDPTTMDRLKALTAAKQRAIDNEDYDEAKRIKDAIERLKNVGYQLLQLEERKRTSIVSEDYDTAKIIKLEIDRLRNAVLPPLGGPPQTNYYAPVQASSHRPFSGNVQPIGGGSRPNSRPQPQQPLAREDSFSRAPRAMQDVAFDEQVIPTMAGGRPYQQADDGLPLDFDRNMPEPLSTQTAKFADSLIGVLGEDICRRIFSKTWQFREDGLQQIDAELQQGSASELFGGRDNVTVYTAVQGAIRHTVGDPVAQVSLRAMNLQRQLLSSYDPSRTPVNGEAKEYLNYILVSLLEKAGDNTLRVRDNAEQCFLMLARSEVVGPGPAAQQVLKPAKDSKASSQKHIVGRLSILNQLVKDYRIDNSTMPYKPILEYALTGFKNSNQDVRTAAYNLLLSIYSCVGSRLLSSLGDLRPAQLEMLQSGFAEVDGGKPRKEPPPIREVKNDRATPVRTRQSEVPRQEAPKASGCPFCGRTDSAFKNEDNLDIHWWKDCPMLVACALCSQVVDIITLNPHLLRECEMHDLMRECPRCREAVHIDEFEMHVEEQACLSSKPSSKANRCPLCHDDVGAGVEGWKAHILEEGCPNNDRSNL